MVEKSEPRRSKREFLPPLDPDLAWKYFFDALKQEARGAYDELLGFATGTCSLWASCLDSNKGGPARVLVRRRANLEDAEYCKTVRPRFWEWEIMFLCASEEAAAPLASAAREVIRWENQHRLIDKQGRPHPRAFAYAMNVIGAENGNDLAELELRLPARSGRVTVGQALSDPFWTVILAPCFNPRTESREDFRNRIRAAADSRVSRYLRHLDQSDPTHSTAISKRAKHHFAWLVRYQVRRIGQETIAQEAIADGTDRTLAVSTIRRALKHTADLLGVKLLATTKEWPETRQ